MKDLEEILAYVVDNLDGAIAAFVGSHDGLLIEQHPRQGQDFSAVAAQWTNVLTALGSMASGLKAGRLKESMMMTESMLVYARLVNQEIFCVVIMSPTGSLEKARLLSQEISQNLLEVFA